MKEKEDFFKEFTNKINAKVLEQTSFDTPLVLVIPFLDDLDKTLIELIEFPKLITYGQFLFFKSSKIPHQFQH